MKLIFIQLKIQFLQLWSFLGHYLDFYYFTHSFSKYLLRIEVNAGSLWPSGLSKFSLL